MSSHSSKSIGSDMKSLKSLLKKFSKDLQLISNRQLDNEAKINELTKAKEEKSKKKKKNILMHLSLKIIILLGREALG